MKENATLQAQTNASLENESTQAGLVPPSFGLEASSLTNAGGSPGPAQMMADPAAPVQMQRQLRDDYPWEGIVDAAGGALLMEERDMCKESDIMLPHGTRVTVTGAYGDYLQVTANGQTGYLEQAKVDDLVSNHIEENMVGDQMHWDQSGPSGGTDFAVAARDNSTDANGDHNTPMPDGSPSSTVNCWEMILLAAHQVGLLDRDTIHQWYTQGNIEAMMPSTDGTYVVGDPNSPTPDRGDIIFMNGLSHVVIAQGERDASGNLKVWSFWPPADFTPAEVQAAIAAGNIDSVKTGRVQDTTIEYLADWMTQLGINGNPITFGSPAW